MAQPVTLIKVRSYSSRPRLFSSIARLARMIYVAEKITSMLPGVLLSSSRAPEISDGASRVSALPEVRAALLDLQRRLGAAGGVVVEGRDIGTVVFPQAEAKFFLTATAEERARRRHKQLIAKGISVTMDSLLRDIRERDARDAGRAAAPLRPADDAVLLDTTHLTIDEAIARVLALYQARAQ